MKHLRRRVGLTVEALRTLAHAVESIWREPVHVDELVDPLSCACADPDLAEPHEPHCPWADEGDVPGPYSDKRRSS